MHAATVYSAMLPRHPRALVLLAAAPLAFAGCTSRTADSASRSLTVFVGTYTRGWPCDTARADDCSSAGIYAAQLDTATGVLSTPQLAARSDNPSYLAIAPDGKHLYAVNEVGDYGGAQARTGSVSAFAINDDHTLKALNTVSSQGADPTHLWITRSGRTVLAANYGGGGVIAFGVKTNGELDEGHRVAHAGSGPNAERQQAPHAHFIMEARNGLVYAADLGADKVFIYRLDEATATLTPNDPAFAALPPGSGPRHLAFHPTQNIVYVNAELTTSVLVFGVRPDGGLTPLQEISAVPSGAQDAKGLSTAEVQVTPDGRFLLVSVRGSNTIGVFGVAEDGRLTPVRFAPSGGTTPRDFKLAPGGRFVLIGNQGSNTIAVHEWLRNGELSARGTTTAVSKPVNFAFK